MNARRFSWVLAISLALASGSDAHGKLLLDSADAAVTVDGRMDEWEGALRWVERPGVFLGARNDGDHLYLCLHSRRPDFNRRVIANGMIVRLEADAGIGIRFPVGMQRDAAPLGDGRSGIDREALRARLEESLGELALLVPGSAEEKRVGADNDLGIEARASLEAGELVWELKVPLKTGGETPYAIGAEPGAKVRLVLESPPIDREQLRRRMGGMPGGAGGIGDRGGAGRRGGVGRGGGVGRPGGIGRAGGIGGPPDPVKIKARIRLAVTR